ncbi:uncharacterized protein LOC127850975 isoform X1 [Dreissena polymorpha]|uniref:Uncharacterized protein n=1 Tax=Dreissena polymorpha TaxID=45954 RepID=A0A9D4D5C2_DREPO|nr:uncharacterized protein LOC127850975 isoform X1 [Dreissena polymorpha]KAH3739333.1 hypothetical protein DPMN_045985 [Dreissena polymorpha]
MVLGLLWILFGLVSEGCCQSGPSGSAVDLAIMNQNMMKPNCPYTPCQSACLVPDDKTPGCYICNPSCTPAAVGGTGGNMAPNMIPPMSNLYNGGFNYGQCPPNCETYYEQMAVKCACTTQKQSVDTQVATPSTATTRLSTTTTPTKLTTVTTLKTTTIPKTVESSPTPVLTQQHTETTKSASIQFQPTIKWTHPKQDDGFPMNIERTSTLSLSTPMPTPTNYHQEEQEIKAQEHLTQQSNNDFEVNKLSFLLFGLMGIISVFTTFFFYSWRKTLNKLRRNKDELYFVQKAYRQNSNQSAQPLWSSEMLDPVYTEVPPIPPPRPPVDTCTPLRTLSVSSETPKKEGLETKEEKVHDYLELI